MNHLTSTSLQRSAVYSTSASRGMASLPMDILPDSKSMHGHHAELSVEGDPMYESLADLYAIIVAIECLEKAYVRDAVKEKDYERQCLKLLAQFKTLHGAVADIVPTVEAFMRDYDMNCKYAPKRISQGVPATVFHGGSAAESKGGQELRIFHAVQAFITTMDTLKLEMKAVDEIHPHLTELMDSLSKIPSLGPDHEAKEKVRHWLVKLNAMKAHDELSPDDARQMAFDLDRAYTAFHKFVQGAAAPGS